MEPDLVFVRQRIFDLSIYNLGPVQRASVEKQLPVVDTTGIIPKTRTRASTHDSDDPKQHLDGSVRILSLHIVVRTPACQHIPNVFCKFHTGCEARKPVYLLCAQATVAPNIKPRTGRFHARNRLWSRCCRQVTPFPDVSGGLMTTNRFPGIIVFV